MSVVSPTLNNVSLESKVVRSTDAASLSPEAEVVLLCSNSSLKPADTSRVASLLAKPVDTELLFNLAYKHGVLPLVCDNLVRNFAADLSPETKNIAEEFCRQHALRNIAMTAKLIEILRMFEAAGILAVPFKGPTLSLKIYQSVALRQFIDLDILVIPKHFERAVKLLLEKGYELHESSISSSRQFLRINRKKDVSLIHPDDNFRVELHWKLSGSHFSMPIQLSHLWGRMDKTALGGIEVGTLPFDDLFVYLCLHAARHGFERLEWICDLNELIQNESGADWERIRHHARIHGCEKALELSLLLVYQLFATRPDYPEFHRVESDKILAKTARIIRDRLFSKDPSANGIGDWYVYHLNLKEKRLDRAKLHMFYLAWYFKIIFRPNSADKTTFALPTSFYPLYFVLRPARLLFNYFTRQTTKH
jgi:hypothetical protein